MRFPMILALLAGVTAPSALPEDHRVTATEELLEAPGGHPVAILLPGATVRRGEQKDGYVHVVVEGWVRAEEPSAPATPPQPEPSVPIPSPDSRGAVSGRITLKLASGDIRYGAGSRVMLLGNVQRLEVQRGELAAAFQTEGRALREEIAALEARKASALSSSENFTKASQNLDRTKSQLAGKTREYQSLQARFAARELALLEEFKTAETFADPAGAYRLEVRAPGEYRIWASYAEGDLVYRWYLPVSVGKEGTVTLDLVAGKPGNDPFLASP